MFGLAVNHFKDVDPILHGLSVRVEPFTLVRSDNLYSDLCETIISQQLSNKAAKTIFLRFKSLFRGGVTPKKVLETPLEELRSCGLSNSKAQYIRELSVTVFSGKLELDDLDELSDSDVIETLTSIKGIGNWTAEMFLIFSLGREDVFSAGDLVLRNAIDKFYGVRHSKSGKFKILTESWSPYRSYASRILWDSLDS